MGSQNDRPHLNWNTLVLRGKVIYQITKQETRGVSLMCHCFSSGHAKLSLIFPQWAPFQVHRHQAEGKEPAVNITEQQREGGSE